MSFLKQLAKSLFPQTTPVLNSQQQDPYNQTWGLWLRHFNGDSQQLATQLLQTSPTLSLLEAQELLATIREETEWAMSEFYDVRDGRQTREQAVHTIQKHLHNISGSNLNNLISYCQYSSER